MTEAMTSEQIVEAEWLLKGHWTKLRFAFQTASGKGNWSDIDVLAYEPEAKHLVIAESKVQGRKENVYVGDIGQSSYWSKLVAGLPRCCEDGVIFDDFSKTVRTLTVQLVSNFWIDPAAKNEATKRLVKDIKARVPIGKVEVMLDTTIEVVARVIEQERSSRRGRRYGHPVLDMAREFNRYLDPRVLGAGRSRSSIDSIRARAIAPLYQALSIDNAAHHLET